MKEPNVMIGMPLADDMFADVRASFWCYQEAGKNGWTLKCENKGSAARNKNCLLYTSPSPRDRQRSRMPSSA